MNILLKICTAVLLGSLANLAQAQTAIQCVRSLVEPRGQDLLIKARANVSPPDSSGLQSISLTRECLAAGLQDGRVKLANGQLQYLQLLGRSSDGVMIHQFDPKVQLGIYSRISYQSGTPIETYFDVYRNTSNFSYQIFVVGGIYHESITWGLLPAVGDENVR
jgi:hypothetical protein